MLSREVMGIFCLVVLWTTALLVAASAFQLRGRLAAKGAQLGRGIVGVVDGAGPFARASVTQVGRALDPAAHPAIAFHDRAWAGELVGGAVVAAGARVEVAPSARAEIWVDPERFAAAAACGDVAEFDAAWAQAKKAKGWERTVGVTIEKGERVWVHAQASPPLVATFEPHAWLGARARALVVFAITELFVCGVVTRIAVTPPVFGTVSMLGAVLGIAFFLGVTPLGVKLREATRFPHEARLRGTWERSALTAERT
jgi:hypothetical protein